LTAGHDRDEAIIRDTDGGDLASILALYSLAFPDEDLRPLVSSLIEDTAIRTLSLAPIRGEGPVGHILFTLFADGAGALIGPLCIHPDHQGQGIGSTLVRHGLAQLEAGTTAQVFVLGDPAYYGRFDFTAERRVQPPHPMPPQWQDAWQSLTLANRVPLEAGPCRLPDPWMPRALWLP